jgi:hypothetical protein
MKYLLLISCFLFFILFSYSQDLDLNKTDIKIKVEQKIDEVKDTVNHVSMKINYSYLSGLDLFYFNNQDKINGSKSGIVSLSFYYRANKWKYGIGMNFSNYSSYKYFSNYSSYKYYDTQTLYTSYRILTPFLTFERYVYKNLYIGVHLGCNFIKRESYFYEGYDVVESVNYLPYTKFCAGYQFKLSNRLNFNLELGVGGSMTNTGFAYLFR